MNGHITSADVQEAIPPPLPMKWESDCGGFGSKQHQQLQWPQAWGSYISGAGRTGNGACTVQRLPHDGSMIGWRHSQDGQQESTVGEGGVLGSWLHSWQEHQDSECRLCLEGGSAHLTHLPREDLIFPAIARPR